MPDQKTAKIEYVLCPLWATAKKTKELFGLSRTTLNRLVDEGLIRRKKTGDGPANGALFSVSDINEWFEGD